MALSEGMQFMSLKHRIGYRKWHRFRIKDCSL